MKVLHPTTLLFGITALTLASASAQDWPQWRGPNRDGKAAGFKAPDSWPGQLNRKWKSTVGRGDASPALVGDKLYLFTRQDADEQIVCLNATDGKELWREKYEAQAATEPMGKHPGPRSSPAVAQGKVVAYGVRGTLSCVDAATGKLAWRKDDFAGTWPKFFTSSSPLIADNLCIAQLGGDEKGGIIAYDLNTGAEKWKWTSDGSAYSSPVLMTLGGTKMVVAMTAKKVVALALADGKQLLETAFPVPGRAYNAATPIVDGQTVIYTGSGRGTKAVSLDKSGDSCTLKELWANADNAVQFNSPVLKDGRLYGISQKGDVFCLDAKEGKTLWTSTLGGRDFGSVVDVGPVLLAMTPQGELSVFEPSEKEYKKLASYKVAENEVYATPVPSPNGIYIKDQDSVSLWSFN